MVSTYLALIEASHRPVTNYHASTWTNFDAVQELTVYEVVELFYSDAYTCVDRQYRLGNISVRFQFFVVFCSSRSREVVVEFGDERDPNPTTRASVTARVALA